MIPLLAIAKLDGRTIGVGLGLVAGAALLAYLILKNADKLGATVAKGVVDAGAGAVLGIGDSLGVPRTNMTECERAIAEGRTLDASFACPAGTFIGSLFGRKPAPAPRDEYAPYEINPRDRT